MITKITVDIKLQVATNCKKCFAREICKFEPNSASYASGPCLRTHDRALKVINDELKNPNLNYHKTNY